MDKKQDWGRFCNLIRAADEITVGKPRSEAALSLMFEALGRHSFGAVKGAVSRHVETCKFAVTPADIARQIEGAPEERSLAAWRCFLRAVERHGYYDSVRFPGPAYHYAIGQLGGWERLCEELHGLTDREVQFRAKDWRQLYETGLRVASWDGGDGKVKVPGHLPGSFERDCLEKRLPGFVPAPVDAETGESPALPSGVDASGEIVMSPGGARLERG